MSTKLLQVGITGGIGSGKTIVSNVFKQLGVPVYYADDRAKTLQEEDEALKQQIKTHFGSEAYTSEGKLNRVYLSEQVFSDAGNVQLINSLVHPVVARDFEQWVERQKASYPYVLKEAALLIEAESYKELDKLIVVTAPEELRIQRVLNRDPQRTEEQVRDIIQKQLPEQKKTELADFVIRNDDTELVIPQALKIHHTLLEITPKS